MKHLKTYEGLFSGKDWSFLKRKHKETKFVISDDMYNTISDIIQDADMMGLRVHTVMTEGKRKVYSVIDRGDTSGNTGLGGAPIRRYYNELRDYDLDEMCYILTRLVDYVRGESEDQLNVNIDFIDNGPHSQGGFRITNPPEHQIRSQLSAFDGNPSKDWRSLQISITPPTNRGTTSGGPR